AMTLAMCVACVWETMSKARLLMKLERLHLPRGASDAVLTPYHVTRGKMFVRERLSQSVLDGDRIARAIELTRFPVPDDDDHADTNSEAGLVRAADLIGQLADPR